MYKNDRHDFLKHNYYIYSIKFDISKPIYQSTYISYPVEASLTHDINKSLYNTSIKINPIINFNTYYNKKFSKYKLFL